MQPRESAEKIRLAILEKENNKKDNRNWCLCLSKTSFFIFFKKTNTNYHSQETYKCRKKNATNCTLKNTLITMSYLKLQYFLIYKELQEGKSRLWTGSDSAYTERKSDFVQSCWRRSIDEDNDTSTWIMLPGKRARRWKSYVSSQLSCNFSFIYIENWKVSKWTQNG